MPVIPGKLDKAFMKPMLNMLTQMLLEAGRAPYLPTTSRHPAPSPKPPNPPYFLHLIKLTHVNIANPTPIPYIHLSNVYWVA